MTKPFDLFWKSLLVGAGYATASSLTTFVILGRWDLSSFFWAFAGGSVIGFTLGLLASSMPTLERSHLLIWGSVIFFNIASVTIEGRFFAPELVQGSMMVLLFQQLLVAMFATWLIVKLFALKATANPPGTMTRSWFSWLWRFITSALSYVLLYYFFGAINYLLITGPYYETHAGGLTLPAPETVLLAELIRGPMIILSVIPYLLTFNAGRKLTVPLTGVILFVVGGVAPLLMQVGRLPVVLLAACAVEIFFQNYFTGAIAGRLLERSE